MKNKESFKLKTDEKLKKGGMGTASLVCGLVGIILFGIILGPLAIIFGGIGMSKKQKYSAAGLILGIIDTVFSIIFISTFFN